MSRLNDDVLRRCRDVVDGRNEWAKEQVAAMQDYSQHVRGLSSKLYPRMFGEKGIAQVVQQGKGSITLTWITNGRGADEQALPELPDPLLIEEKTDAPS